MFRGSCEVAVFLIASCDTPLFVQTLFFWIQRHYRTYFTGTVMSHADMTKLFFIMIAISLFLYADFLPWQQVYTSLK
jgi:hypothetical protein